MTRFQQRPLVPLLTFLLILASVSVTRASNGPKWSDEQLIGFSNVILTGRVVDITSGWDTSVNSIYTYVHVDVDDVLKGAMSSQRVIVKQLGGVVGDVGLAVSDQPAFVIGEDVLLFLEIRPRDGTLYTSALWQGKWNIQSEGSLRVAVRTEPGSASSERRDMRALGALVQATAPGVGADAVLNALPAEALDAEPFVLIGPPPYRYAFSPPIDVQAGGQPGLAGGGLTQLATTLARWNGTGSSFKFGAGSGSIGPRCYNTYLGTSRVTISFMDPCGEIASGGTLAVGGSYYNPNATPTVVNGVAFQPALEGFIVNNDSASAVNYLTNSGCFSDIELHELGHVLGLGHSADAAAIMYPTVSFATCSVNASGRNLGVDDVNGQKFIYPGTGGGVPGQPTVTSATVTSNVLTVVWTSGSGASPTSHRLDFYYQGGGFVTSVNAGAATSINIPLPANVTGAFSVRVTAFNGSTAGPGSALFNFTIGPSCTIPASPNVTGDVVGSNAYVTWPAVPGATRYLLSAGTTQGGGQYVPLGNIGNVTYVSAGGLPPGFTAWVRVIAVNACNQQSVPRDYLVQ